MFQNKNMSIGSKIEFILTMTFLFNLQELFVLWYFKKNKNKYLLPVVFLI